MYRRTLATMAALAAFALPTAATRAHAQDKPVTVEQVGKNVEAESKRTANRTGKAVRKAGRQTEAQAKRSARSVKKLYSRKERRRARGELQTNNSSRRSARATAVANGPRS